MPYFIEWGHMIVFALVWPQLFHASSWTPDICLGANVPGVLVKRMATTTPTSNHGAYPLPLMPYFIKWGPHGQLPFCFGLTTTISRFLMVYSSRTFHIHNPQNALAVRSRSTATTPQVCLGANVHSSCEYMATATPTSHRGALSSASEAMLYKSGTTWSTTHFASI
jgi:hypothetical protein